MNYTKLMITTVVVTLLLSNLAGCSWFSSGDDDVAKKDVITDTPAGDTTNPAEPTDDTATAQPAGFTPYSNLVENIELSYPSAWEMEEGFMGSIVMVLSPLADDLDMFQENLNIVSEILPYEDIGIEEYKDASISQIESLISDYTLESAEKTTIDGLDAYKIAYTGSQGLYNLKWMQYLIVNGAKAYVITYTSEVEQYEKFLPVIEQIAASFKTL